MMSIGGHDARLSTAENYRAFAREAHNRSPAYESLANAAAGDENVLSFLSSLPRQKRQPNLLFASARYLLNEPPSISQLRALVGQDAARLAQVMLAHRTQTNEPARCATILPALAQIPEPLALIEVGASAGLALLFDRYSYDYGGVQLSGSDPDAPLLRCGVIGKVPAPIPDRMPDIVWRAGLDINPLDVTKEEDVRWLSCHVWPGESDRQERLDAAVESARRDPPAVHRGDLLTDLPALAAQAPREATVVVYHSAVLAYVAAQDRRRFAETMKALSAIWLSNEAPGVVADVSAAVPVGPEHNGAFLLVRDGRTPLALTDGHGTWLQWLEDPR
jgi:hypothetical protein